MRTTTVVAVWVIGLGTFVGLGMSAEAASMLFPSSYPVEVQARAAETVTVDLTAVEKQRYRKAVASYYGPGLYGNKTWCGQRLNAGTRGVAFNLKRGDTLDGKRVRCGTLIRFRHKGRAVTVPVIDDGPHVAGRTFDLTEGTRAAIGFPKGYGPVEYRIVKR